MFSALLALLRNATFAHILIFEDVHWADMATIDLIKFLGRRIALLPALLVLSLRDEEVAEDHALTLALGDVPGQAVLRLKVMPLSEQGVSTLAQDAGASDQDLYRITGGNPFFVTEVLAGRGSGRFEVPASIRQAVWTRMQRLPAEERQLLEIMSIEPAGLEPWFQRALFGSTYEAAAESCLRRGLLQQGADGTIRFRHELARLATLEQLAAPVQRALHARAETVLSKAAKTLPGIPLSLRVHHAAGADDGRKVLELAPLAASEATKLGAHQQAAAHLAICSP